MTSTNVDQFLSCNAMIAWCMPLLYSVSLSVRLSVSVCPSMCLSITHWYCVITAKLRITQIMPHDSPGTLVFVAKDLGEI